jgi:hypothetical protein
MRSTLRLGAILLLSGITGATAQAINLYGNNYSSNNIDVIDPNTGALIHQCTPAKGNGRGIVVVGTVAYFTVANSNNVYKIDINTCADLGIAFSVTGSTGLSTVAYDGTNFWIGDYSGTNNAYYYSPTGTLLKTISLSMCSSYCDGLEYFNGKLISNRGDIVGPYDVYDTNGNLLTPNFIDTSLVSGLGPTGIAFDGTNFYVSDIFRAQAQVFDGTTGAFIKTVVYSGGAGSPGIEDLSFDYQQVLPTPTPGGGAAAASVPMLSTPMLLLLAIVIVLVALLVLRSWS